MRDAPPPDNFSRRQGLKAWLFGRRDYAHPALRWVTTPLFRLAWLPFVIDVADGYRSNALFAAWSALLGASVLASGLNAVLLRRDRERRGSQAART